MKPKYSIGEDIYWLNMDEKYNLSIKSDKIIAIHIFEDRIIYDTRTMSNLKENMVYNSDKEITQIFVDNFYHN